MLANWHSLHQDVIVILSLICLDIATRVRAKISEFMEHSPILPTEPKARANRQSPPEGCCGFPCTVNEWGCCTAARSTLAQGAVCEAPQCGFYLGLSMERRNGWEFINYGMDLTLCMGRVHHYDGPQTVLRLKTVWVSPSCDPFPCPLRQGAVGVSWNGFHILLVNFEKKM